MPIKPSRGGGSNIFTTSIFGPPPGPDTAGTEEWIDLGLIPTGNAIWFGSGLFASPDKSITFEIRTSNAGKSAGTLNDTTLLASTSVSPRSGQVIADYYKNGRLHTASVFGTGVEHFWLRLKSRTVGAGSYLYQINYTLE